MNRARIGNMLLLSALTAFALGFAAWQRDPWWHGMPDASRIVFAGTALALWFALCLGLPYPRRAASSLKDGDAVPILWASQTGFATQLAEHSAALLETAGIASHVAPLDTTGIASLKRHRRVLVVASTTGEGDPPDHALGCVPLLRGADLTGLHYAVLALGDHRYTHFCAYGRQLDDALRQAGATPLFDHIEVDAGDPAALRHWQQQLGQAFGGTSIPDWVAPEYQRWRLAARECLNPGGLGAPVHRLWLEIPADEHVEWRAGDIAEIGPRHSPETIDSWLAEHGLDGRAEVRVPGKAGTRHFADLLAGMRLPVSGDIAGRTPQAIADTLEPLPHREYSIASIPSENELQLLVREMYDELGRPGLGSGWLTRHAGIGDGIELRIRGNPCFHPPDPARPMILIGNGTGIAGLRAHLAARAAAGIGDNWLLFGERQAAHDTHFADDLRQWQAAGLLARFDAVHSRDGGEHRYVQDALRAQSARLRQWVENDAAIYVCGSLRGMAPAVDAVIEAALGATLRQQLLAEGRYRRDVY
ncbi:sulfite reductase flavoprotein subunit alpha [Lysobacter pythonis]|uniref:NADPH--hemoprotein reductase n=1 Tax=Solilutibacter pythonis TaxID=2483112 RepID=A0A3M2I750_9GAMM|nr:sulfite reductase subunit alpha [Lysobacter pythonis]RMH94094.1 sulfite reductase flavoprotein subunit alpha [Lysobacter pythonis]